MKNIKIQRDQLQSIKRLVGFLCLIPLALSLASCSSCMIRQECEKIDWHQHGFEMATQGKRLTGDPIIMRCKGADFDVPDAAVDVGFKQGMERYCQPDFVLSKGREGEFFNEDFCSPSELGLLRQKHREGLQSYCTPEGGFNAGSSGKKYQGVCPTDKEKVFMVSYKKGRAKYLKLLIQQNQATVMANKDSLQRITQKKGDLYYRRNLVPGPTQVTEKVYNPTTNQYDVKTQTQDPGAAYRSSLDNEINSLNTEEQLLNSKQNELLNDIAEKQKELITLE